MEASVCLCVNIGAETSWTLACFVNSICGKKVLLCTGSWHTGEWMAADAVCYMVQPR